MSYIPYIPETDKWDKIRKPIGKRSINSINQSGKGSSNVDIVNPLEQVVNRAKAALKEEQKEEEMSPSTQSKSKRRPRRTSRKKAKPRKRQKGRGKRKRTVKRTVKRSGKAKRRFV